MVLLLIITLKFSHVLDFSESVNEPHHIAQTQLILDKEEQLLDDLASWVSTPEVRRVLPC